VQALALAVPGTDEPTSLVGCPASASSSHLCSFGCRKQMNMIPQLAHHPRHLSQQFGSPGFAAPPFEPLPSPRRPDRLAPLPFRVSRNNGSSSVLAPPHRAYPVENHNSHRPSLSRGNSAGQSFGSQYDDPSEHMLRRKTPNGTLAAGYDGTPVQWSSKAPALKHVVLPLSGVSLGQNGIHSAGTPEDQQSRKRSGSLGWNHQQTSQLGGFNAFEGDLRAGSDQGNWTQFPSISDPSHNMWDQLWTQQSAAYFPNNVMQIPTVLQPAYQPAPGPTASNDGGLYGPYWPDGRFVPYRPAAFRGQGPHFHHQEPDPTRGLQQYPNPPTKLLPPFQQSSFSVDIDTAHRGGNAAFPFQENNHRLSEDRYATPTQSHPHHVATMYPPASDGSRTPTAQSASRANNPRFKEKTLSWAHSIYVDLLAFLHHSKKENRQSRHAQGLRSYSKNSIYPKPPRHPGSYVGASNWTGLDDGSESDSPRRHFGSEIMPWSRVCLRNNYSGWQGLGHSSESRHGRTTNPEVPHYVPPFQPSQHLPNSPLNKAREALEMLTNLCEQSGWCWIDGMLLGGCLAYGLEEYHKALDWYSKIIALDPK
jgi:hypothetical protein